jgi:hypothetical protein
VATKPAIVWPFGYASDLDRYQLEHPSHTCVDSGHLLCPACEKAKQTARPQLISPPAR